MKQLKNLGIKELILLSFFSNKFSDELPKADLVIANNVLAHVPDINDFMKGIKLY